MAKRGILKYGHRIKTVRGLRQPITNDIALSTVPRRYGTAWTTSHMILSNKSINQSIHSIQIFKILLSGHLYIILTDNFPLFHHLLYPLLYKTTFDFHLHLDSYLFHTAHLPPFYSDIYIYILTLLILSS